MEENVIHITDLGVQAANNAAEGGFHIDVTTFKLGDSDVATQDTDEDIVGNLLYTDSISLIEVVQKHASHYTFTVPAHAIPKGGMTIKEVGLFLDNNILFGRCVFATPYVLREGYATRIHAMLITDRVSDMSVINVTIGDFTSIPSCAAIHRLPPPDASDFNALSVLDALDNIDGTATPGMALKFGAGALQWAFSGYDSVYVGLVNAISTSEFKQETVTSSLSMKEGETIIAFCVSGPARGQSRKFVYSNGTDSFTEKDNRPMLNLDDACTLVIWRRIIGAQLSNSDYPPKSTDIPPDWVITRGVASMPVWAPPKNTGKNLNTLYVSPGKLRMSSLNYVGTGQVKRYDLGGVILSDVNHCINAIGGITQHNAAYDIAGSEIEYAENIPPHAPIDIRLITKEPGTGTFIDVVENSFVCDGSTTAFKITKPIESSSYALCYIKGILQAVNAYTYDASTQEIVFVAPPNKGLPLEISCLVGKPLEGYSTKLSTTTMITVDDTWFVELPIAPQTKEHTFVSVTGTHIHRDKYSLIENKIIFSSPVKGGLEVEVLLVTNIITQGTPQTNLKGIVNDAVLTSKSLKLLRHDDYPIVMPIPAIDLVSGPGIKITGKHPSYKIENTYAQQFTSDTNFKFSILRRQHDSEEIIYTYRVNLKSNMVIQVLVDFAAILGPGFVSPDGLEIMQYVIGFRTTSAREPEYGRDIKGTGEAGFSSLPGSSNERAFSNASLSQVFEVNKENIPAGYIDVVVRMRVRNANISKYGSKLTLNFNIVGTPKIT